MKLRRAGKLLLGLAALGALAVAGAGVARAQNVRADADLTNKDVGSGQALLGNVVADALREQAKTDVALVPASAFAESAVTAPKTGFTVANALKTLEYKGETIGIVKVSGEQLRAALEQSLYQYPARNVGFLQTSGLTVTFTPSAAPMKRITAVKVNGSALDNGKTYRVAMPMPLANGAHAYFKYWKKSSLEKDTGVSLETALTNYLNAHKTITKGEDRLVANK